MNKEIIEYIKESYNLEDSSAANIAEMVESYLYEFVVPDMVQQYQESEAE